MGYNQAMGLDSKFSFLTKKLMNINYVYININMNYNVTKCTANNNNAILICQNNINKLGTLTEEIKLVLETI
jgi:hypothetical protein